MISSNVQRIYDEHVAGLTPAERLRLVELITRSMSTSSPMVAMEEDGLTVELRGIPGWQPIDHRGDLTEWRDRAL